MASGHSTHSLSIQPAAILSLPFDLGTMTLLRLVTATSKTKHRTNCKHQMVFLVIHCIPVPYIDTSHYCASAQFAKSTREIPSISNVINCEFYVQ